jgi:hypothetical protein
MKKEGMVVVSPTVLRHLIATAQSRLEMPLPTGHAKVHSSRLVVEVRFTESEGASLWFTHELYTQDRGMVRRGCCVTLDELFNLKNDVRLLLDKLARTEGLK